LRGTGQDAVSLRSEEKDIFNGGTAWLNGGPRVKSAEEI